jgi:uncharacterized protein DUF1761
MEKINIYIPFLAALIPLVVGAVYYSPPVLGNVWMKVSGTTEEKLKTGNLALIFGLTYLFSLIISGFLMGYTIHQSNIPSLFMDSERFGISAAEAESFISNFQAKYSQLHRTFSHGAVHGIIATLFFALPLIAINSLFERRGWKYILIHTGYWLISLVLMGGVICKFL